MNNGEANYRRFLDGDDQGIVEIIKDYKDALMLFINSYVHNIHIAEELTEDVFFSLVVKKPKFSPKFSFKTWLFTIGRNRALNTLRFHSKVITTDKADVLLLQKDELDIEKAYIIKEDRIRLHQCIQRLLPQYSEVLYLAYFEMLSVSEIATVTKRNSKQISNLLYRAKEALKEQLIKEGFEYEEMAKNVLERRDIYLQHKKKTKLAVLRYGTSLLCFLIVIGIAFLVGYKQGLLPSPATNSNSSLVTSAPSEDSIWVPYLPELTKDSLQGNNSSEEVSKDPWFDNFNDFENWLITGKLAENIDASERNDERYLSKWVYMWKNANQILKTGYYYRPAITNESLDLGRIDVSAFENGYCYFYRYFVNHSVSCDNFNAYKLSLFVNDSQRVYDEFKNEYEEARQEGSQTIYNKISCNQLTYHVFISSSGTEECNFIGIYWEQDGNWFYAYYLASKQDPAGYKEILQNLNMVKTPFRDDLKP